MFTGRVLLVQWPSGMLRKNYPLSSWNLWVSQLPLEESELLGQEGASLLL